MDNQALQPGHPLGGEQIKIVDDVIDFEQYGLLMMFCHKMSAT